MKFLLTPIFFLFSVFGYGQFKSSLSANEWADSVLNTLSDTERIAQLMIIRAHSNLGPDHVATVSELISAYNVGGLCFFQGGPVRQALLTNQYQAMAKTPLMITIDAEWGLGMRLDSVKNFQREMMLGALPNAKLAYKVGRAIADQCKRLGIHLNFAPVVDVNNNPLNPVINDRSFGENKFKVALMGVQYMKGMQDNGVMACAKHFPGHGDVSVDSHYDLPVINKTLSQLDSLELYPFRQLIKNGVGSIMMAHLYIPAIDTTANLATSLSYNAVSTLLKNELQFDGLTFTDALEMKGVTKFFPSGEASVQSLLAGNDMLCLPEDVPGSIEKIKMALDSGVLSRDDLNARVKKVLVTKYHMGMHTVKAIDTTNLVDDLNKNTEELKQEIAQAAITLLKIDTTTLAADTGKIAYIGFGMDEPNSFAERIKNDLNTDIYLYNYNEISGNVMMLVTTLKEKYSRVIIGLHNYSRRPANQFGITSPAFELINLLQSEFSSTTVVFGNPYAISPFSSTAKTLIACYEDDDFSHQAAADFIIGKLEAKGQLPVTVSPDLPYRSGIAINRYLTYATPEDKGMSTRTLQKIDEVASNAIKNQATPGCVVLVARNGKVVFEKAYGYTNYDSIQKTNTKLVYDLASVTKISATTVSVMKLYEEGKLDIEKTLGDYLLWVKGTNKENIKLKDLLLHRAGLVAWIPFFRETVDEWGVLKPGLYAEKPSTNYTIRVAENLYMRNDYLDTLYHRILTSKVSSPGKYVYSDLDFIFLGKVVEAISGKSLQDYTQETFYNPLKMTTTSFKPREHFPVDEIAPTENDTHWRHQLLTGDVHDPGAAMFGGIAGHAGLFSNAYDLAQLYQMLLNSGELNGQKFFKKSTIDKFTAYAVKNSRRGLGFDKPERDNAQRENPYPTLSASPKTYGHTGFTGTCVWVDPEYNLVYIFLSNRVTPRGENNKLLQMNVRSDIHEIIYNAITDKTVPKYRKRRS